MHLTRPTKEGVRRWPPDGYLQLNPKVDVRRQVACTCTERCGECRGDCGCEACELGWLVYQDDQALWNDEGELINIIELGTAWKRVADPRQLRLRFQRAGMESTPGVAEPGEEGDGAADDHLTVPPIYHDPATSAARSGEDGAPIAMPPNPPGGR
jgi:hypothetical protein